MTGRHITAAEALSLGLIGYVVPDGQALDRAQEIARRSRRNGPLAVQAILRTMRETEGMPENEAFAEGRPLSSMAADVSAGPM